MSNEDVFFNMRTGIIINEIKIREGVSAAQRSVGNASTGADWDGANAFDSSIPAWERDSDNAFSGGDWASNNSQDEPSQHNSSDKLPVDGLFSLVELEHLFGKDNVRAICDANVRAPRAFANKPEYEGDLLDGVSITTRSDGYERVTEYRRRFCGCEKELQATAGKRASYVILMLGPSSSGKTMYLIALHKALDEEGNYFLPPEGSGGRGIAKVVTSAISSGGTTDTSLRKMSDDLFDDGQLPNSTFAADNEPLVLDVSVNFKGDRSNRALLFLRDLPGEWLTNPDRTEELYKLAGQFPKFDAFIMMIDPFTFKEKSVFRSDMATETVDKERQRFIRDLDEVLTSKVSAFIGGSGRIDKPTAVIVTKGDHFFNRDNFQKLENKEVLRSFPSFSSYQKESFDKVYFSEVDKDVNRILSNLSPNITKLLEKNFSNTFAGLVSALSKAPIEIEYKNDDVKRGFVKNPNIIKPWRVADPFIRLLMRLHIVPPFDEVDIRTPDGERHEEALARNTRYLAAVNAWGRTYCVGWSEIAGEAIILPGGKPIAPEPPPKKSGWFSKKDT